MYAGVVDTELTDINLIKAQTENRRLIEEYFAITAACQISSQQNIQIGQTLNMHVMSVSEKNEGKSVLNSYLSGRVMVSGITHIASPKDGYSKAMVVSRSGMGLDE